MPGRWSFCKRSGSAFDRACGRRVRLYLPVAALLLQACDSDPILPLLPPLDEIPADLAEITFLAEGRPTAPYTMLEVRHPGGFRGFVAVNGAGQPVWYHRTLGSPHSFARRENGNFVFLDTERGLVEVSAQGEVIRELPQEARPARRMHHDVLVTHRNTVLFIAEEWQPWQGALLNGEAIWEWTPETSRVQKRWTSFDHLSPAIDWGERSVHSDWLHANSLSEGPRGNILLSLHHLNQVISITPDFQSFEWRMGGIEATISVPDPFSGQHTVMEIRPGRVLMFDNGFERLSERYSRAVEYEIAGGEARKVWEWRPARDNWARVISSARRLPNGNTLVAFGVRKDMPPGSTGPIEVYEVDGDGRTLWHLALEGAVSSLYRATPLFSF